MRSGLTVTPAVQPMSQPAGGLEPDPSEPMCSLRFVPSMTTATGDADRTAVLQPVERLSLAAVTV